MKQVLFVFIIILICSSAYPQVTAPAGTVRISSIEEFHTQFPFSYGNTIELVGWSNAGSVAYIDRLECFHSGHIFINLVIFDAIRDVIIDRVGIDYRLWLEEGNNPIFFDGENGLVLSSEEIIISILRNWNEALERNGIRERIHNFDTSLNFTPFQPFPLIHEGKTFDSWFEIVVEERFFYTNFTWSLIGSNSSQTKVISSGEATNDAHGYVGSTVLGFYKSPYENRLVVIVAQHDRTLGQNTHGIRLYGFHLDVGFD